MKCNNQRSAKSRTFFVLPVLSCCPNHNPIQQICIQLLEDQRIWSLCLPACTFRGRSSDIFDLGPALVGMAFCLFYAYISLAFLTLCGCIMQVATSLGHVDPNGANSVKQYVAAVCGPCHAPCWSCLVE